MYIQDIEQPCALSSFRSSHLEASHDLLYYTSKYNVILIFATIYCPKGSFLNFIHLHSSP